MGKPLYGPETKPPRKKVAASPPTSKSTGQIESRVREAIAAETAKFNREMTDRKIQSYVEGLLSGILKKHTLDILGLEDSYNARISTQSPAGKALEARAKTLADKILPLIVPEDLDVSTIPVKVQDAIRKAYREAFGADSIKLAKELGRRRAKQRVLEILNEENLSATDRDLENMLDNRNGW